MYLPQNDISEVVLRQRNRRDDLSKELAKNKSKLNAVQQEYRFLIQPLNTDYVDECERLDDEIDKLRRVCQVMSNEIETLKRAQEPQHQFFEQRQRQPLRPAPPPPPYPPPRMRPQTLFPRQQSAPSPLSPRSPASSSSHSEQLPTSPSLQELLSPAQSPKMIDDDVCDPNCGEQPWQCSMCTFQNHPLLNICECCGNVRILPGSVRIVPSRPPPPIPFAALGSRSAPLTPATPMTPNAGPASAGVLTGSTEYTRPGVTNSNSEGSMPQFLGDVIL